MDSSLRKDSDKTGKTNEERERRQKRTLIVDLTQECYRKLALQMYVLENLENHLNGMIEISAKDTNYQVEVSTFFLHIKR